MAEISNVFVYPDVKIAFDLFDQANIGWWGEELQEFQHKNLLDRISRYGFDDAFWSEEFQEVAHQTSAYDSRKVALNHPKYVSGFRRDEEE